MRASTYVVPSLVVVALALAVCPPVFGVATKTYAPDPPQELGWVWPPEGSEFPPGEDVEFEVWCWDLDAVRWDKDPACTRSIGPFESVEVFQPDGPPDSERWFEWRVDGGEPIREPYGWLPITMPQLEQGQQSRTVTVTCRVLDEAQEVARRDDPVTISRTVTVQPYNTILDILARVQEPIGHYPHSSGEDQNDRVRWRFDATPTTHGDYSPMDTIWSVRINEVEMWSGSGNPFTFITDEIPVDLAHGSLEVTCLMAFGASAPPEEQPPPRWDEKTRLLISAFDQDGHDEHLAQRQLPLREPGDAPRDPVEEPNWFEDRPGHWGSVILRNHSLSFWAGTGGPTDYGVTYPESATGHIEFENGAPGSTGPVPGNRMTAFWLTGSGIDCFGITEAHEFQHHETDLAAWGQFPCGRTPARDADGDYIEDGWEDLHIANGWSRDSRYAQSYQFSGLVIPAFPHHNDPPPAPNPYDRDDHFDAELRGAYGYWPGSHLDDDYSDAGQQASGPRRQ